MDDTALKIDLAGLRRNVEEASIQAQINNSEETGGRHV
ncbi:hypothetical protein SAMN04489760_12435 [Syntrophus gentianae]|uniref:Uncharacterized protein n=1 Tax=Syntrophus gentianae TaxID=43775 RepID=A0A1H7ZKZ4_9BACT|nr:hypothetical protein SAMN04489760_12435 [Syntrophus gentianae]